MLIYGWLELRLPVVRLRWQGGLAGIFGSVLWVAHPALSGMFSYHTEVSLDLGSLCILLTWVEICDYPDLGDFNFSPPQA